MNTPIQVLIGLLLFLLPHTMAAQETDTLVKKLDSLRKEEAQPGQKPLNNVDKETYTKETNLTFKTYFILLGTNMVQEVTGPFHAKKSTWIKVGGFVALEAGLFFADKLVQRNAVDFMARNPGLKDVSTYITHFGGPWEVYTLAAFGAYGFIFKSNKVKTTTLLATQSYIIAGAVSSGVKFLTGRQRPNAYIPNNGAPQNHVFRGPSSNSLNSSFPSGHTTAAFSAATVFAHEYKDQVLIPVIAYTAAALIGLSRISENAHWATDVLAGAALGYVTGRQVVYNYHRYAKLRSPGKRVTTYFNLQYMDGVIMPGMICKF